MSKALWIIVVCLLLSLSQQLKTIDCLHVAHVTLNKPDAITAQKQYSFPVTWTSALSDVSQSALALRGYQVQQEGGYLSYQISLQSAKVSGGTITLFPTQANTEIVSMQFEVLLVGACGSDRLELLTERLTPTILSQTFRATLSKEVFLVSSSNFDLADSSDFYISAFLVDFETRIARGEIQEIRISDLAVRDGDIAVTLHSLHDYENLITTVTVSVFLVKKSAFKGSFVHFNAKFDSYCFSCNKTYNLIYPHTDAASCIAPLSYFRPSSPGFTPQGVLSSFDASAINFRTDALSWAVFNISCYLQCDRGSYFGSVNGVSTCQSCPSDCETCLNSTYCLSCSAASFLSSDRCVYCSPGCLNCIGLTACSLCEDIYALSEGQCSDCKSMAGFYLDGDKCYSCHSSCISCFGTSDNCSSCVAGYKLDTKTSNCLPEPNQIHDCFSIEYTYLYSSDSNMTLGESSKFVTSWSSRIHGIRSAALVLAGFKVGPRAGYLSFHSQLANITSLGANILLTPFGLSSNIFLLQYNILIVRDCGTDTVSLFSKQYFPTVLSDSSRSSDSEHVTIVSPVFDLTQSSNYFISVYLQDFVMFVPGNNYQRIGVDASSVQVYNGDIRFVLYSHVDYFNTITSVTFTILIAKKHAYPLSFNHFYEATCTNSGTCYDHVPYFYSRIAPQLTYSSCVVGFYNLRTGYNQQQTRKVFWVRDTHTIGYQIQDISWAEYNISCFLKCQPGEYFDWQAGECSLCPLGCASCINATACCRDGQTYMYDLQFCNSCQPDQYVLNNTCFPCPRKCSTCNSDESCITCPLGFAMSNGDCIEEGISSEEDGTILLAQPTSMLQSEGSP